KSFMVLLVLLGSGLVVDGGLSEIHSLHYIYTALSRPVNRPGIHEFTAMGMLDDHMIDYFDSDKQVKVPKQTWMKTELEENYWEKGTQSRKSKQQWFKVNIKILKDRFRQNDSDIHVLQWVHGCNIDTSGNETEFLHGIDMYSYDGESFLTFDEANENWVAPNDAALQTKRKWDDLQVLKEYTKVYLKKECVTWLERFLKYQKENTAPVKPAVYALSREANVQANIVLTCMATGFSSINTIVQIKRDGLVLTKDDGDVRPNGDGTYQKRDQVEIPKSDKSKYTCEVIHESSGLHEIRVWDTDEGNTAVVVGAVVGVVVVVVLVIGIGLYMAVKK
uniref:Major histocompatibility complex class I ZEA n=1 Tax=Tetraodon nigroviridis TaxID=99883 RepID=H3CCR3_TETNG